MRFFDIQWADLFRDYGVQIASSAATITALIAMILAQFFKDHRIAKVLLVGAAIFFGSVAIGTNFYSQHQLIADRLAEAQRRTDEALRKKEIREQLGAFIAEGLVLIRKCSDASKPPPLIETGQWVERINKFLGEQLGNSYTARLVSPSGVPIVALNGGDKEHNELFRMIYAINFHLEQFSQEPNL